MFRTAFFLLSVNAVIVVLGGMASGQEPLSILPYLGQRAARLAETLPPVPETREAWESQRSELVQELTTTLGLPSREPMKAAVTDRQEAGDLVREQVAYLWAERAYVSATLIYGKQAAGRRPAIVVASGWLGHYSFLPYQKFVDALARQGMTVLFIDDPRAGPRQAPYAGLYAAASAAGTQVAGIQVFDALRALDYLLTRSDVDAGRIGIAGWGEGAVQAYLAAAVEARFQFVIVADGTTTYAALAAAAGERAGPEDPSAYVSGLLRCADLDRVGACLAPRPVLIAGRGGANWPISGHTQVLRTMKAVYKLYDASDRIHTVRGEPSDSIAPYLADIQRWLTTDVLPALPTSDAAPPPCGAPEEPDFNMLRYLQRRLAAARPIAADSSAAWQDSRKQSIAWLRAACALDQMQPSTDQAGEVSATDGLATQQIALGVDGDYRCPAVLVRPETPAAAKCAGVIFSHNDRESAATARIADAARRLASAGCCVLVPDHVSVDTQSRQTLAIAEQESFYGDEAARFYGPADAVGLPPLALRVRDNLAAFRYLASRPDVDPARIIIAGIGIGGVDACLAAVLEERIAAVASIDATTIRDWAVNATPGELHFFHIMPYLPGMGAAADLDAFYAALAPRPLMLVQLKDGWPRTGFEQVAATASAVYKLEQAEKALLALGPRDVTEELEAAAPEGIHKQLITAARTLVPTPPQIGIVGSLDGLKSRQTVDSASGLIWIVAEQNGYEQEFAGTGYQLDSWSFFNNNGDAQKGRAITPLVFKQDGDRYQLTAIGKTEVVAGTGLHTFAFEPLAGVASVGDGYFFGWYDGNAEGQPNAGVVEFEDARDAMMIILTADGQMGGQKLQLDGTYRMQSQYRRHYSIMAVSKKP
jgi:dienelactone hydrolase